MDHLQTFISEVRKRLLSVLLLNNLLLLLDFWLADQVFKLAGWWLIAALFVAPILSVSFLPWFIARALTQPTKLIWQAILHIAPDADAVAAPDLKSTRIGRELVNNLVAHVYQLASVANNVEHLAQTKHTDLRSDFIASNLPLPLVVIGSDNVIMFANEALLKYINLGSSDVIGKDVYSVLDFAFNSHETLDAWLASVRGNTVTASNTWEHVRLNHPDQPVLQFDLAAYYNKDNPEAIETMLVLFDHTKLYAQDDQAISFVALAVHELRAPTTLIRGYIEALDEKLAGNVSGDAKLLLQQLTAAGQQLTSFVNNILNVARIESDQLELKLQEENWTEIVRSSIDTLRLRAEVHGITLECHLADDLPPVGVDRMSIYEVLSNLIDNAIKYSGDGKKIIVTATRAKDGLVETTVQDFGVGIPESVVPELFTKFYRSHRSRDQVGGTGLGLYLCKAIVSAHGGNIWVRSHEGEGTTFGFTVLAYEEVEREQKAGIDTSTRTVQGWIKNHSMYRR